MATLLLALPAFAVGATQAEEPLAQDTESGVLVLDAAMPSAPIVSDTTGTSSVVAVKVLNAPPMTGGFTLFGPGGDRRFANQASDDRGVVDFFEVSWLDPQGRWTIAYKPGMPGISPEQPAGVPQEPEHVPDTYESENLLSFDIAGKASAVEPKPADVATPDSLPTLSSSSDSGPSGFTFCAMEYEWCSFTGRKQVAFGADGSYRYTVAWDGVDCNLATFWDPVMANGNHPGESWACYTEGVASDVDAGGVEACSAKTSCAGAGPSDYVFCANEGAHCSFTGTTDVAYGAEGFFNYKYGVSDGINCNNAEFGDPYPGRVKACHVKDPTGGTAGAGPPKGYVFCTPEGRHCSFNGIQDVAFGANGHYAFRYAVEGGIDCSVSEFGDPYQGPKSCYTKPSSGSTSQTEGCSPPRWELQANHWKWVNQVVVHSPQFGTATSQVGASTTTEEYFFGSGNSAQKVAGWSLNAWDGETAGHYKLMGAAYYHDAHQSGSFMFCPREKVVLTEYLQFRDNREVALQGASKATDEDDISDFWDYSLILNANVKAISVHHQFKVRDNGVTTSPTGQLCRDVHNIAGTIQGFDIDVSFTLPAPANVVSVGGSLVHKTTQTDAVTYQYCFGQSHSYDWDNLGGTSDYLAAAFRTNW